MTYLRELLEKPAAAALFFFFGVIYDNLTLTRIDRLIDNLILLCYLLLLGWLIVLFGRGDDQASWLRKARPYYTKAIQFLFGGLFSAYAVFYSKSASFTSTAIFSLVLVGLLVGNEFLHDRLSNVRLLVGLYSLVSFSFFTFVLPVVTGLMNTATFLLGAAMGLGLTLGLVHLITQDLQGGQRLRLFPTGLPAVAVTVIVVVFYFLNWIPPVPLSLRFGGIYHEVTKGEGGYHLTYEKVPWYRPWQRSDDPYLGDGPAYCFTAVFAPVDLTTTVYHRWQTRSFGAEGERRGYVTTDRIGFSIAGGRDDGYRGYTVKQQVAPGDWRVDVETADGRIIGRVAFRVEAPSGDLDGKHVIVY